LRAVVAGGAGFLGSHLCERLLAGGWAVVALDNFLTGNARNVAHLADHPRFQLIECDVARPVSLSGAVDAVLNLASPASPKDYARHPLETLEAGSAGTRNLLDLAAAHQARFLLASTSEVYGDPLVHPQAESYWGNVNPVGPRSCYDESKRFAEAITAAYRHTRGLGTSIARIFNTYGPRMKLDDGRVVPALLRQALSRAPLTIFGDGSQTRSFCYVRDLIDGLCRLLDSGEPGPINIGNPEEMTILEFAERIIAATGCPRNIVFRPLPDDDPKRRKPDITRARTLLGWEPRVTLDEGLAETMAYFRNGPGTAC
jgi:dTDP-glucose 4,6-dehydratase